uniref:Uncharacterized protein n=1 Tax=Rhizophora mucronata TaxID=61149 RepID=A0A2P2PAW5_RHIMU
MSPNSSPIRSSSINALESSLTAGAGIKRRLVFKDCDQNYPEKKIRQQ